MSLRRDNHALQDVVRPWFSDDLFEVSPGIYAEETATSEVPSLCQCFLYLSWLASDKDTACWDILYEDSLVRTPIH